MILTLIQNLALLIALAVVVRLVFQHRDWSGVIPQIGWGLLFGTVATVGMLYPYIFLEGVVIDGRSIVLSVAGFFGGPIVGLAAAVMTSGFRLLMGGAGATVGLAVIFASTGLGVAFHYLRQRKTQETSLFQIWIFGLVVHVVMIILLGFIPEVGRELVRTTAPEILLLFPMATVVVCWVFQMQMRQMQTEMRLQESERRLSNLMSHLPGMVYRCQNSSDWKEEFISEGCLPLTGYTVEEFMSEAGGKFASLMHPDDRDRVWAETQSALESGESFLLHYRMLHRNGEVKHVEDRGRGVTDDKGHASVLEGFILDVTEREEAAREKEKLEDQLRQAMKIEAVGRLAGGVAHDFNNMLSVINGYSDLAMKEAGPNSVLADYLTAVRQAGQKSADLTRQLLAFARKQRIQPETVDLNEALRQRIQMLERLIGEEIDLALDLSRETLHIRMDPAQLDQVLVNLVINSRDAIASVGSITITTRPWEVVDPSEKPPPVEQMAPGRYALLSIADTGCGMDAETISHLFEPFFTTKSTGEGTGLGLATVHGILSQNHSFVSLDSAVGKGTVFHLYFPCVEAANPTEELTSEEEVSHGGETLLLVEDEEAILRLSRLILEPMGYQILSASTPSEALRLANKHSGKIDLLVTDVIMPEMNGFALWQEISKDRNIPCLYISGYTADILEKRGMQSDKFHFLEKPFTRASLASAVRRALSTTVPDPSAS